MANREIVDNTMMEEDKINFLDYWRVLVKRKLLIGIIVGTAIRGAMFGTASCKENY
jgi:uncharacterized protein involved in exopolysaccharide biosynthesis